MKNIYFSFIAVSVFSANVFAATYTVTTLADAGAGSLREAIGLTNASVGVADIIDFTGISGTITLASVLPPLTDDAGVTIDGSTATGYVPNSNPLSAGLNGTIAITIDGGGIAGTCMAISSDANIIRGLNFINVGTAGGVTDRIIRITAGADNNQILGCYIGTDVNGTASAGANTEYGIQITDASNNQIGDGTPAGSNLISGLRATTPGRGIYIEDPTFPYMSGNTVKGNIIGLQKDGATYLATTQYWGIWLGQGNSIVGGTLAGEGNVISGNNRYGIYAVGSPSSGNSILGNIIGPQANGISNVVNNAQMYGIFFNAVSSTTITGNIISANLTYGIYISVAGGGWNVIKGNYIGPGATLASIAGSDQDYGVNMSSDNSFIGGSAVGEANTIAFNTVGGVNLVGAAGTLISRNLIYSNGNPIGTGKPINLNSVANNNKATPVITTATTATVVGTSTTVGDIVEVFINTTGNCNDAVTFVGSATTDGFGNWSLAVSLTISDYVLATATDASNNTSEFSPCLGIGPLPVELLYFNALCNSGTVKLSWATATESNNDYFTVERTLDGFNYKLIGTVKGAGNSSITQYYSLTDNEPLPGIAYYRLKQTDFNGQYKYFPLVAISCGSGIDIISIYPNPAIGDINIIVSSSELTGIRINLIDVLSRKVITNTAFAKQGNNTFNLDLSTLSSGSYMLQVVTESGLYRAQKQFVVK